MNSYVNLNKLIKNIKTQGIDISEFQDEDIKKLQHFLLMFNGLKTERKDNCLVLIKKRRKKKQ